MYNAANAEICENRVAAQLPPSPGLDYFNDRFTNFLRQRHSDVDICFIRLLEISQFARMLPFKMAVDEAKFSLYALGSYLFWKLQEDIKINEGALIDRPD